MFQDTMIRLESEIWDISIEIIQITQPGHAKKAIRSINLVPFVDHLPSKPLLFSSYIGYSIMFEPSTIYVCIMYL